MISTYDSSAAPVFAEIVRSVSSLNSAELGQCLAREEPATRLREDSVSATRIGSVRTPLVVIDGMAFDGALPRNTLRRVLRAVRRDAK